MGQYWILCTDDEICLSNLQKILLHLEPESAYKLLNMWDEIDAQWSAEDARNFFGKIYGTSETSARDIRNYLIKQRNAYLKDTSLNVFRNLRLFE